MTTTNVNITSVWSEAHGTAETIDVSCNEVEWFSYIGATKPAETFTGRKLEKGKIYNIEMSGTDNLYARTKHNDMEFELAIDV